MEYPWYEKCSVDDYSIQQGDFIIQCPIVIPPFDINEGDNPDIEVRKIDSIVLSQSCDLVNGKIDIVLVCPYYPLSFWIQSLPIERQNKKKHKERS